MKLLLWIKCIMQHKPYWQYNHTNHYYREGYFGVMNHYEYDVFRCSKCGLFHNSHQERNVGFQMKSWHTTFEGIKYYKR